MQYGLFWGPWETHHVCLWFCLFYELEQTFRVVFLFSIFYFILRIFYVVVCFFTFFCFIWWQVDKTGAADTLQAQWQNLSYLPQMKNKMPLSHCDFLGVCVSA